MKSLSKMSKKILIIATALLALAVSVGAFGAHALKNILLETGKTEVFETAVRYHFYHSFGLLFIGIMLQKNSHRFLHYASYLFVIGILIFCGSLYTLALTGFTKLGMLAPIGGLSFILGWLLCAYAIYKTED
jgi:uncharacterized membrane protein YgdD (TMEM256/DUF423 family)